MKHSFYFSSMLFVLLLQACSQTPISPSGAEHNINKTPPKPNKDNLAIEVEVLSPERVKALSKHRAQREEKYRRYNEQVEDKKRKENLAMIKSSKAFFEQLDRRIQSAKPRYQPNYVVTSKTQKAINRAFNFYNKGKKLDALTELESVSITNESAQAYIAWFEGMLGIAKDRDDKSSFDLIAKAYHSNTLTTESDKIALIEVAKYSLLQKRFQASVTYYELYIDQYGALPLEDYLQLANAYYFVSNYNKTRLYALKAIELTNGQSTKAYHWLTSSLYKLGQYHNLLLIAEQQYRKQPEKARLMFFSNIAEKVGDYKNSLFYAEKSYKSGKNLKKSELEQLIKLYSINLYPSKAAKLLDDLINKGKLASSAKNYAWLGKLYRTNQQLYEAAEAYGKASELSYNNEYYYHRSQLLLATKSYQKAVEALKQELEIGALDKDKCHFSLGVAYYYLKDYQDSLRSFNKVNKNSSAYKTTLKWLEHLKKNSKKSEA